MAQKSGTSRAEKEAAKKQKKKSAPKSAKPEKKAEKKPEPIRNDDQANLVAAVTSLGLFILFLVMAIKPDGALTGLLRNVLLGLIGRGGVYLCIPAFFYLFFIHTFGYKKDLHMRSFCTMFFVMLCGSVYHLVVRPASLSLGFRLISDLYLGGNNGISGGLICGGFAELLLWSVGNIMSYILLSVLAVVCLLGAMQITIPSLYRAISNRPRDEEWDDEEEQEYVEPAAVVVNHLANMKKEHRRQRRERMELERQMEENPPELEGDFYGGSQELLEAPSKASSMMNEIGLDISAPLAGEKPPKSAAQKKFGKKKIEEEEPDIPDVDVEIPAFVTAKNEPVRPVEAPAEPAPQAEKKVSASETQEAAKQVEKEITEAKKPEKTDYQFPPVSLLRKPVHSGGDGTEEMRENSRRLNETLASFKIDAHIINVTRGPSVTRYEVELDKGVRLNKLTGCADDIALSLGASGVRIAAVPGKISVVGIEVPNRCVTTVSLREVIDSGEFNRSRSHSSFAVGKDIGGSCIIGNIAKMPHLLIAGTTGSGKSVCMNSIIISLLYKSGPDDVKLIMVDPKMVELGIYNGIPHLLIPVVTDPKKAAGSLQWAVVEMMRRYKMMSDAGVRDLESYNSIITAEEDGETLPQVVIIIDELADLMLVAAKEVEDSICRIAQMGRAAGMHLIIATQRPSADVITGLMKANIPSRIAFSVASSMESRIILDTVGAEKLVGKGDMLYAPIGIGKPMRVQGCFVSDGEVEAVAEFVKENSQAVYNQEVLKEIEKNAQQTGKKSAGPLEPNDDELEGDEMLPAAVDVILETGQASVSMLQRRLKLGYARAARIVDEMEEKGIVGPFQGSKPRSILITKEQWHARQGSQMDFDDMDGNYAVPEEID